LTAQVPAGSTGICGDGTYTKAKTKTGACSNHGGVKTWLETPAAPAPAPKPAPPPKPSAPARPANATGMCTDGSFTTAKNKSGACSNHGGVKDWYYTGTPTTPPPAPRTPPPPPAPTRPTGATGMCTDGSFTTAKNKSGACSNHGGVKDWYYTGTPTAPPPPPPPPAAPPTPPTIKVAPIPGAPAAATALCNDGTYSESQHRSGTCSNHKGVKQWLKNIPPQ
jgi:hypothetical protein